MRNEDYEQYEIIKGRRYRYDPDYDCYYRAYTEEEKVAMTKESLITLGITVLVMGVFLVWGFSTGRLAW